MSGKTVIPPVSLGVFGIKWHLGVRCTRKVLFARSVRDKSLKNTHVHFERKNTCFFEKNIFGLFCVFLTKYHKIKDLGVCVFSHKITTLLTKCPGGVTSDECFRAKCPGLWLAAERF